MQNGIVNINDFFTYYKKAAWEQDIPGMLGLYSNDVIIFDMWGQGVYHGLKDWAAVITNWLSALKEERVHVTFEMIAIEESKTIAFANAFIQFEALSKDNTVLRSMKNRITLGFVKTEGLWKVKHQHTSAPIDADLNAILHL
jgi:ketosteroid isomerase-like protein